MLQKGSSIARLCDEHPSYANAAMKTYYVKNNKNSILSHKHQTNLNVTFGKKVKKNKDNLFLDESQLSSIVDGSDNGDRDDQLGGLSSL